jgi:hypothetical protein
MDDIDFDKIDPEMFNKYNRADLMILAAWVNTLPDLNNILKDEFLFKGLEISDSKKIYATIQEPQEGNIIPQNK